MTPSIACPSCPAYSSPSVPSPPAPASPSASTPSSTFSPFWFLRPEPRSRCAFGCKNQGLSPRNRPTDALRHPFGALQHLASRKPLDLPAHILEIALPLVVVCHVIVE